MLLKILKTIVGGAVGIAALVVVGKIAYAAGQEAAEEARHAEKAPKSEAGGIAVDPPVPVKGPGKLGMMMGLKRLITGKKSSAIGDFVANPEDHKMEAYIEGGEIVLRIKKKLE